MISAKDLYFLEMFDKATPVKTLIKENNVTIVYKKIKQFKRTGLIVKKKTKKGNPTKYDTTVKGAGLIIILRSCRELL